jgi:hypothetical protein
MPHASRDPIRHRHSPALTPPLPPRPLPQETKLQSHHVAEIEPHLLCTLNALSPGTKPGGSWRAAWACSTARKGYAGVATLWSEDALGIRGEDEASTTPEGGHGQPTSSPDMHQGEDEGSVPQPVAAPSPGEDALGIPRGQDVGGAPLESVQVQPTASSFEGSAPPGGEQGQPEVSSLACGAGVCSPLDVDATDEAGEEGRVLCLRLPLPTPHPPGRGDVAPELALINVRAWGVPARAPQQPCALECPSQPCAPGRCAQPFALR